MNACLIIIGFVVGCAGSPPPEDSWMAEDKLRHFTLSFATTALSYGGARMALGRSEARAAAGGIALAAGLAKEVRDARGDGIFSLKDLAWNAAGVALGLTLSNQSR